METKTGRDVGVDNATAILHKVVVPLAGRMKIHPLDYLTALLLEAVNVSKSMNRLKYLRDLLSSTVERLDAAIQKSGDVGITINADPDKPTEDIVREISERTGVAVDKIKSTGPVKLAVYRVASPGDEPEQIEPEAWMIRAIEPALQQFVAETNDPMKLKGIGLWLEENDTAMTVMFFNADDNCIFSCHLSRDGKPSIH